MRQLWIRATGILAVAALSTASAHAGRLFSPIDEGMSAKARVSDPAYLALLQGPATSAVQLVEANSSLVKASAPTITLNLGPGLDLLTRRVSSYVAPSGSLVWYGVIADPGAKGLQFDPLNTVMLVKNGSKITGNVHYDGKWYEIRPLKARGHAIVAVDLRRMPPEHPPTAKELPIIPMPQGSAGLPTKTNSTITVMVNYTAAAASASGDINGLIDLAIAESNQGYTNGGVAITMQLVHKSQAFYTESSTFDTDLARYRGTNDGYMDHTHILRNASGADVAVLLINNSSSCGLASGIGSSVSTAFAVVHWGCATGYYSFAHEIGHLLSARHDQATDPTNTPYAYGHGYQYTGSPNWRTIMAYDCSPSCPRLDYWSNPNNLYNGHPMGTTATNDNARVLNGTRTTVAAFKSAPSCIPDGGIDDTLSVTSCCSGYAVNGSTVCTNPADYGTTWASCNHVCGTAPVNGCIPSGGIDDTLGSTSCCSSQAVSGSTWCLNPGDWGTTWASCVQVCQ
jgi:hypothetical protein